MSIATKNKKMMEYYKKMFLEYASRCEADEEMRLATEYEVKVKLHNITQYSTYLQGARMAMLFWDEYKSLKSEKAYDDAVLKLATSDLRHMDMFLNQTCEIRFRNHEKDKKGKIKKVEAYFAERVILYKEV